MDELPESSFFNYFYLTIMALCIFFIFVFIFVLKRFFTKINILNLNFLQNFIKVDFLHEQYQIHHPLTFSNGWICDSVKNGRRIFIPDGNNFLGTSSSNVNSLSFLSNISIKNLQNIFLDPNEFVEWNFLFQFSRNVLVPYIPSDESNVDCSNYSCVVPLKMFNFKFYQEKCCLQIRWKNFENSILIIYEPKFRHSLNFFLIIFYFTTLSQTRGLSLVMATVIRSHSYSIFYPATCDYIDLVSSLFDYSYLKQQGAYLQRKSQSVPFVNQNVISVNSKCEDFEKCEKNKQGFKILKNVFHHENSNEYIVQINDTANKILQMCYDGERDGWIHVGKNKSVDIWRLDSQQSENPVITVKGKNSISVSSLQCFRFLADERNTHFLDELFDAAPIIEKVNNHTEIRNLKYKTIWPLKKRDFSVILCGLHVNLNEWCLVCFSIIHPRCLENSNYVRGEVLAGYLLSGDQNNENCFVTYVLSMDLKGSIPSWAINRLMNSQPLIIDKAKSLLESHAKDIKFTTDIFFAPESSIPPFLSISSDPNECSKFFINNCQKETETACANNSDRLGGIIFHHDTIYPKNDFDSNSGIMEQDEKNDSSNHYKLDKEVDLYRKISSNLLDAVQNEIKESLEVHIDFNRIVLDFGSSNFGKWQFIGFEKKIVIMRKQTSNNIYGFLGMGLIKHSPAKVFDVLRNPQNRFIYDNMVKNISTIKEFGNGMYILRMQHEHNQCFVKKSRESCLFVSEHILGSRFSIVSKSVESDLCPQIESIKRLHLHKGGWFIEPREKNGKYFSKVYYIVQIDLTEVPQFVINYIGKRQPLSIAYLRDFISQTDS